MSRIAAFLAAFGLAAFYGQTAVADGGGRDYISPFKFEYVDEAEEEPEADPEAYFYSWLARGSRGEFG